MGNDGTLKREFAKRLTRAMNDRGWNGSELARRASKHHEVTRDNISSYCNGKALAGPAKLNAIAKALGVEASEIMPLRRPEPTLMAPVQMRDLGDGSAHITVDRVVPYKTALNIMTLLEGAPQKDNGENAGQEHQPVRRRASGHR